MSDDIEDIEIVACIQRTELGEAEDENTGQHIQQIIH